MCARMYIEIDTEELKEIARAVDASSLKDSFIHEGAKVKTSGEVFPTDVVPVIASNRRGGKAVFPMQWGFQIPGRGPIINARVETAGVKLAFREAWSSHRCVIPTSWYFEWQHYTDANGKNKVGDKFAIQPKDESITWLCGLYRMENNLPRFTVLTKAPGDSVSHIHDRMPLILPKHIVDEWIRPDVKPEDLLPYALTDMTVERCG